MWQVDRPTSEERRSLLGNIRGIAAENDAKDKLTMRNLALGQFDSTTSVSCDGYEAFDPVYTSLSCRVLAGTENGRLGTLHHSAKAEEGDQVWILHGCRMPMILRPVPDSRRRFTLIGWMLLPGAMHGEAFSKDGGAGCFAPQHNNSNRTSGWLCLLSVSYCPWLCAVNMRLFPALHMSWPCPTMRPPLGLSNPNPHLPYVLYLFQGLLKPPSLTSYKYTFSCLVCLWGIFTRPARPIGSLHTIAMTFQNNSSTTHKSR